MREGGHERGQSFIDRIRTVGSQDRVLYKLEYRYFDMSSDTHTKGG